MLLHDLASRAITRVHLIIWFHLGTHISNNVCSPLSWAAIFILSRIILTQSSPSRLPDEVRPAEWTNDIDRGRPEGMREGSWRWTMKNWHGQRDGKLRASFHAGNGACSHRRPYYSIITVCLVCCPWIVVFNRHWTQGQAEWKSGVYTGWHWGSRTWVGLALIWMLHCLPNSAWANGS